MTNGRRGRSRAVEGGPGALRALTLVVPLSVVASYNGLHAQCPDGSTPPCRAARAEPGRKPGVPPNSIAVLYFDNLSRDTADAYLADGLTEDIIVRLGQIERLTVKSRNAVKRFRERGAEDPAVLGQTLGVAYLVSGSVRRAGPRLRVTVQLVRAADGLQVWGDVFDRSSGDLLSIGEENARAVAAAVAGRLLPAERSLLTARPTRQPGAYDHFLRGNFYLAQRTARAEAHAAEEYEAALRLDPGFGAARGRIAYVYGFFVNRGWSYPGVSAESLLARGLALADRVLRSDSTAVDAWLARGNLLRSVDPPRAKEAMRLATVFDPQSAEAFTFYGAMLRELGDDAAASRALLHALELDPASAITMVILAGGAFIERRYQEASRWTDSALTVDPGFHDGYAMRGLSRLYLGDIAGARADAETALRIAPGEPPLEESVLAQLEVRAGDTVAARARVDRLLTEASDRPDLNSFYGRHIAAALVALGNHERALEVLERIRPRGGRLGLFLRSPEFDALRTSPRFQRLVEESRPR